MTARLLTLNCATTSVRHVAQSAVTEASLLFNSNKLVETDTETDAYIPLEGLFSPSTLLDQAVKSELRPIWKGGDHRKSSMPLSDCEYADVR